ncbi:MAG TPA: TetR/AcrR family transcriptional regulator [Saccharospirillum sp.]|nr:TetR/AcrR family transcriptional regulator [Saccharospirillum sp.]
MNDRKRLGRPRGFDYDEALKQATSVFWAKGYDGASLRDLTSAMGITGPSMYASFGDKRELYLKTIDHYIDADSCAPLEAFETEESIQAAIRGFLIEVIRYATEHESGAKGCFLASSVVTTVGQVEGVAERVAAAIEYAETRLAARFDREVARGTLPSDFPSRERAALLYDMRQGYMFRARAGWSREQMMKDIEARVHMLLSSD